MATLQQTHPVVLGPNLSFSKQQENKQNNSCGNLKSVANSNCLNVNIYKWMCFYNPNDPDDLRSWGHMVSTLRLLTMSTITDTTVTNWKTSQNNWQLSMNIILCIFRQRFLLVQMLCISKKTSATYLCHWMKWKLDSFFWKIFLMHPLQVWWCVVNDYKWHWVSLCCVLTSFYFY